MPRIVNKCQRIPTKDKQGCEPAVSHEKKTLEAKVQFEAHVEQIFIEAIEVPIFLLVPRPWTHAAKAVEAGAWLF